MPFASEAPKQGFHGAGFDTEELDEPAHRPRRPPPRPIWSLLPTPLRVSLANRRRWDRRSAHDLVHPVANWAVGYVRF